MSLVDIIVTTPLQTKYEMTFIFVLVIYAQYNRKNILL